MTSLQTTSSALARRKLPIGIQTFRKIREANDYYYIDKTGFAVDLIEQDLFEGHQALFTGLTAETSWDWSKTYPVIRVSFSDGVLQSRAELDQRIRDILRLNRETLDLHFT